MFPGYPSTSGSGKIVGSLKSSDPAVHQIIAEGLPSLLEAMAAAEINTPRRIAAFLTTLVFESGLRYNRRQITQTRVYYGRGFIQLTGRATDPDANGNVMNYTDAGKYLGINMVATAEEVAAGNFSKPDLALDIRYSARIATWYWTKARPRCNEYADAMQMGKINAAIGYPLSGSNDSDRCMVFAKALQYLTPGVVNPVPDCNR